MLINYTVPQGWDNQIRADIILNYFIQYEKLLVQPSENFEIIGSLESNVGTWKNTFGLEFTFRAGMFNSYFCNYENPSLAEGASKTCTSYRNFQLYFLMTPVVRAVMDNATLQGGFFTHLRSPYTLTKYQITNGHMQFDYGFVIAKNRLGFSFSEKLRTAEYKGGVNQQTGNLILYIGL
jgi:lipid A 3-O-deacylase